MFYKLGQNAALDTLGFGGVQETPLNVPNPFETLGFKKKHEGYFGISGPGTGASMGTAIGTSVGTGAHALSNLLGINILERTGLTLPQTEGRVFVTNAPILEGRCLKHSVSLSNS